MNSKLLTAFFLILVCLSPSLYMAVTEGRADEEVPVYSLGEVVVTGKTAGVQATESVYTVTAEDIQARGARTLDQAINLLPGVNMRIGGDGVPRIDVRGFRTRHVLLLLDGIPINSALDAQFDPRVIPTENIAKMKMTTGASSILYGQGGLGGVINIITKKGTKGLQGMIGGETGDHESYLTRGSLSGGTDGFDFFASGSSTKITAFPLSSNFTPTSEQDSGYRNNSDIQRNNLFGSASLTPNEDLNVGFTVAYTEGSFGKPGSILNEPFDPFASPPKYERIDHFNGLSLSLAADYDVSKRLSVRGWTYLNQGFQQDDLYDNRNFDSFNLIQGSFREHIETRVTGAALQPKYDLGKAGVVTLALAAERDSWVNSGFISVAPDTFSPADASKAYDIYSTGIEYEISPLKGLGFVAGYGHYWQDREEQQAEGYSLLEGVYYDIFDDTRLKANYKRDIRFPTLSDLYNLGSPVGNPNLATERSRTYEAGVEQRLPHNTVASLTAFYTSAKNLIQNDQVTGMTENLPEIDFSGFEAAASTEFVKRLLLRASYTYLNSRDFSRPENSPQQYTPGDRAALEAKYDFDSGFTAYASYLYVGNQFFYTKNAVTPMQKLKLDNYELVNVRLSQKFYKNRATLYLGVNNLFDRNYETAYGFPQAGRFVYVGVEFHL
jgi:outer membrane cobalamin receptor